MMNGVKDITVTNKTRINLSIVRNTLIFLVLLCGINNVAWGDVTKSVWDGAVPSTANVSKAVCNGIGITGSGTEAEPYIISTAQQFAYFASKMNGNTNWWKLADNVELDLDGTNHAWTYGQNNANFKGHFDGNKVSGSLISNMKFVTNATGKGWGLFPNLQGNSATNHAEVKNLEIKDFTITTPTSGSYAGANIGLLVGKANGNTDIENITVTGGTITVDVEATGGHNVAALVGQLATAENNIKNCSVSNVSITSGTAQKKEYYVGGITGNAGNYAVITGNSVSNLTIIIGGKTNGNNIIGGLIGKVTGVNSTVAAGLPMGKRSLVQKNTVTSPSITMNGSVEVANLELGGMIGWVGNHVNVFNNKVTSPAISIKNNINANSYVGGAVGYFDKQAFIDGVTVDGTGSITGPDADKTVKNAVVFFVGGFLGYQNSSAATNFDANKFKNIAVTGMNISLGNYKPQSQIKDHKFSVGGIAGSINAPNMKADGTWGGMPENLIFKGGKIYAPWASTSPTVSNFNAAAATHQNMTPDQVTTIDAIEKAKVNTWYYNDYKLGLSSEFLNSTSVKESTETPKQFEFRKNYSAALAEEGGIKYLAIDNNTFAKSNRYQDSERDSKTVLWWTQQASMDKSKGTVAAVTCFTANEQPIYPQSGATSAQAGNLTDYPHYMYFFQGVSNAKYASEADATKLVAGIEANFTNNILPAVATVTEASASVRTVTITNDGETKRGFDARNLTVTVKGADDSDITSSYTYQWYVDGKAKTTGTTLTLTPHWKDGQGVTVNVINGSTVVATASYGFAPGVMHTQKSFADASSEKIRSDINARGTSANPYIIDCENALRQLSYLSTANTNTLWDGIIKPVAPFPTNQIAGHYNRAYYELGADISMSSDPFIPISHVGYGGDGTWGTYNQNFIFQGHFDGKGHKISGLKITWGAGQYNGNNANIYYGLFGTVGNPTATAKWGETAVTNTVIKNLVIDGATLTHDINNTSFYYNSTIGNYSMVGVLAGIVNSNTTVQNIVIRNSSITDVGSTPYSLATKGLYVGGAIGSVQAAFNATANVPANTQIQHIVAKVDITLAQPYFAKETDNAQINQFNVGGIIGRFIATGGSGALEANVTNTQAVMPKYTLYSGTVNAPKAWISPVLGSLRYKDTNNNGFGYYSRLWEGNNNTAATQIKIANALYYNFYIGGNKITDSYPSNTCGFGNRTLAAHADASEAALTYSAAKYQGVNYDARYIDTEGASLAHLNQEPFDDYNWVWSDGFVHMTTEQYVEAQISREGDTFTATLVGGTAASYTWKASFDGEHWEVITGATESTYTAPKSLKPKFIVAIINDGTKNYRTLVELVEADKTIINPTVTNDGGTYHFNLGNTVSVDHLTTTYEWYYTKADANNPDKSAEEYDKDFTPIPSNMQAGVIWCKVIVRELGVTIYEDLIISGATVVYIDGTNGHDNGTDDGNGGTYSGRGWTKSTPVKTIDHANSLLKTATDGGTVDNNIIVVMGTLNPKDGGTYVPFRSNGANPATLTGVYQDYTAGGTILIGQKPGDDASKEHEVNPVKYNKNGHHCYIRSDMKFENLTFEANSSTEGNNFLELHGNDVTFGHGLVMRGFQNLSDTHGNLKKSETIPEFTIILMATNLCKDDINTITTRNVNRGRPQVVNFQSGHYGRLMGGRFTEDFFKDPNNDAHTILASADNPVWAVVNIEIDNNNKMTDGGSVTYSRDINAIIAGLTDGTMYGDYTINFYGGNVAYIVGGNQGNPVRNGDKTYTPVGGSQGQWGQWPNASYFGRTVINVEEKHVVNPDIKSITVGNLYAGGLGRMSQSGTPTADVDMYMYGRTEVNVKSGTISGSVYGGGVGGVIGVNPWDAHAPYATADADDANAAILNKVQYGDDRLGTDKWSNMKASSPMAKVKLHNLNDAGDEYVGEDLDLRNSSTTVNIMGGTVNGNVYGGGYGKVEDMKAYAAMQGIGSVFGTVNINITGGRIVGNVYGGSQGDEFYYNAKNKYNQTITHIAEMNGTVNLNISGTEDKYPEITGNIFGAGKGLTTQAARTAVQADVEAGRSANVGDAIPEQEFADIARTGNAGLGNGEEFKSEVNITIDLPETHPFTGNIYGGGENGKVDGNTNIFIRRGVYQGNVFGAGLGEAGHTETKAMVTGNTNVFIQGAQVTPSSIAGTGNVYGGGSLSKVYGNTNVTVEDGAIYNDVYGGGDQGTVSAMANVRLTGGEVRSNVFGGGNKAVVGTAYSEGERAAWAAANGTTVVMDGKDASVYGDIFGGGNQANIEGNTSITLHAGNFGGNIFGGGNGLLNGDAVQVSADVKGNTFIYIAQDEGGQDQETKIDNFDINVIWDKKWDATNFLTWDGNKSNFYSGNKFLDNHNIYGGGNLACKVGTYDNNNIDVVTKPAPGTGKATVQVFKGMTPVDLLRTDEWKNSYNDNKNPHFYVFGGGFGKNTKVGSTDVTVDVEGEYGEYTAEVEEETEQMSKGRKAAPDPTLDLPVFDNSKGIPNFTVLGVLGGGYAGLVADNAKVTVDGKTFLHRVYGGGFGDPNSTENNTTGQVGGDADVIVNGAHTYGDVFGGGAGVASKTVILDNVARVLGKTSVTVADDANIYGKVYGGGDMACVGVATSTGKSDGTYYTSKPSSASSKTSGTWTYTHSNHQTFVNILGGNIFGEVYGGGRGVEKTKANDYTKVGRIEGNTLLHIANSVYDGEHDRWSVVPEVQSDAVVPYVWNRIYGGCAYGTVDGNTMVHVEGGMLGLNIFGGGYGAMTIVDDQTNPSSGASTASSTLNQVLGKLDNDATFANILGNTKVQIDGGSWIWNRKADTDGNITTWLDANNVVTDGLDGFKLLVAQILRAKTDEDLKKIDAVKAINPNFFNISTRQFSKNHNIFGGGNRACFVGTYPATVPGASASGDAAPTTGTGTAEVIINHSPITKIDDGSGNEINMLNPSTVAGLCWYLGINNTSHPQFSVFGAGYGANTKVGNAIVKAQPGVQLNANGAPITDDLTADQIVNNKYLNYESDLEAYYDFENQIAEAWNSISDEEKRRNYGLAVGDVNVTNTYLRFRASQLAWSMGSPNFTFMDVHGGGFSGYVVGDTKVIADCQLNARNIFGAGLGAKPYGTIADQVFTLGQVGGNSDVFIKSGVVSLNVYGGGAGVESYKIGDATTYTDFPNIALVKGKTNVDVYGETIKFNKDLSIPSEIKDKRIERTSIFGGVYGGGDVACVGSSSDPAPEAVEITNDNKDSQTFTSTVNIRGSAIQSQIYAGGNGRTANLCSVTGSPETPVYGYKNLGAVYGNTHIIVDAADKTYPYETDHQNETAEPNTSPHIWNRIYGGCQNGTVYGNTLVEINGGSLGHNIFGGGFGNDGTDLGQSTGDDDEDLLAAGSGRAASMITSADVTGNTNIIINGGEMELTSYWLPETRTWEPATIKGATTYSPQYDPEKRKFKINHNTYGGGNAACVVGGSTYITMNKGLLKESTVTVPGTTTTKFFELPEWKEVYQKVGSPQFALFGGGYGANTNIAGNTNILTATNPVNSGIDDIIPDAGYKHFKSEMAVMDIVGGGYSGNVTGDTHVNATKGIFARRIFGGGYLGTVTNSNIIVEIADCYDIFGGGLMGDVLESTNITIGSKTKADKTDTWIHGNIYGGNDVSGYINMSLNNEGYFKENSDEGGTNITIYGGNIDGNVYGAGNGDYLYALDREGHDKLTVNEHYLLDPNDANSQMFDLVYTVPMRETMPSYKSASDAAKIVNINSFRPLTNRVNINIQGTDGDAVTIKGDVYGGGNSATVQKVYNAGSTDMVGDVSFNIGEHVNIGRVFMGCNGDKLFTASEDNAFLSDFQKLNNLHLDDPIDWQTDPSNHGISTLYLPTENEQRPIIYPHLLDLYFQPVEMNIQANLKWNGKTADQTQTLTNCTIGTFCCGGNRGNMNVYPETTGAKQGNVLDYLFPEGLTITDKIIGGCNNANYEWYNSETSVKINHVGGYLLGEGHTPYPFIKLNIKNKFEPATVDDAYKGGNVFGGCFETGTVRGDITVDVKSDMLAGKEKAKLEKSNELLASDPAFAALNVYGAGYGMESYVYGNTNILFGEGIRCTEPVVTDGKFVPNGPIVDETPTSGVSANFVYGGGQQGNVIGVTNVDILNGHVYKSVTGGSYSGYVYGSTQVKVGYPKTYTLNSGYAGRYLLKRTDENNLQVVNTDASGNTTPTIKQYINLIPGDVITAAVYDAIYAKYNGDGVAATDISSSKGTYFTETVTAPANWDNINIYIDEACYGGGYSLAQGSSVMANNTTVLKYTEDYNINNTYRSGPLADLTGGTENGTTVGFGGNTMMLIGDATSNPDRTDRDHISISHQEMQETTLPDGTDLFGYYYKDTRGNYRYISREGTYYYHTGGTSKLPDDASTTDGKKIYKYDGEGGIFGDGHLSYAEGFRAADLTGYGFASTTISSPKIINTFQRMDILRLTDNCFTLLGARDYATNATNKTPYSISRVGEIQMIADNALVLNGTTLNNKATKRSRNYMGLANNIHYVGAIMSSVPFSEPWRNKDGALGTGAIVDKSYEAIKQTYIDNYYSDSHADKGNVYIFQKRNDGTAKNMIGIASGYALKIQNVQEVYNTTSKKIEDNIYYGPIYGVVEMNLIDVRDDEGGGYVYADNIHKRGSSRSVGDTPVNGANADAKHRVPEAGHEDFLETTGNFVFPYNPTDGRYIVDDCFPVGYDKGKDGSGVPTAEAHYWYVTGYNYYYNAHITGYTYDSSTQSISFDSDNKDGLTVLAGLKPTQTVKIESWHMRSGHPNNVEHNSYSCDLEVRNYDNDAEDAGGNNVKGSYTLNVGAADTDTYDSDNGFRATLPLNGSAASITSAALPGKDALKGEAKITFRLTDTANNTTSDYYNAHLSEPCYATLVLSAPAMKYDTDGVTLVEEEGYIGITDFFVQDGTDAGGNPKYKLADAAKIDEASEYDTYNSHPIYYYVNSVTNEFSLIKTLDNLYTRNTGVDGYVAVKDTYTQTDKAIEINGTDPNKKYFYFAPRTYTYTIYLTIDYVQGPNIDGSITVENCALPGEMIRVNKKNVKIQADESFSADGYYWRIGKRVSDGHGNWTFEDATPWTKENATDNSAAGYDSYIQTEVVGTGKGFFQGCNYDKTNDYLDIPAYYYMNGYGIQLGVSMNGLNQIFPVKMTEANQLVVHNYHRMHPNGSSNVNLHLAEAVARAKAEAGVEGGLAEPRIYLSNTDDLRSFVAFLDSVGTAGNTLADDAKEYIKLCARQATQADFDAGNATSVGQWIPNLCAVPRYGANAQFVVQNDMEIPAGYDVAAFGTIVLAGKVHGEGHVITGLGADKSLITTNNGSIHNLGMASGKIAAGNEAVDANHTAGTYHCCFEYNDATDADHPRKVYRMDGTVDNTYTEDDFRYGKVAYDLNQYYLEARKVLAGNEDGCGDESHLHTALTTAAPATKAALQYIFDYWANGDYQYARRSDDRTSEITGVTYLRTGTYDDPNYGSNLTRHDRTHAIDKPRAQGYVAAVDAVEEVSHEATDADVAAGIATSVGDKVIDTPASPATPESRTGNYLPLFNSAKHTEGLDLTEEMNDYIYWGQNLQQIPDDYPSTIESLQLTAMTNRVYRASGYYGSTAVDGYYYNAYADNVKAMGTYVHNPLTTAIDFTCQADNATTGLASYGDGLVTANAGLGSAVSGKMYYPPVADKADEYAMFDVINGDVTQNLLVYTDANNPESVYDIFDAVNYNKNIAYAETLKEASIKGHHVVNGNDGFQAKFLHLVERTADDKNSEGASCVNNNFCAPLAFNVTDRAWYTRKPAYYATDVNNAWEGICLPFTVQKAVASINGEITHFYGTPSAAETSDPAQNYHTLHHEYWLRGLTAVGDGSQTGKKVGTFMRPGSGDLFAQATGTVSYTFRNTFFPDTYKKNYTGSIVQNDWYSNEHTYSDYLPLTADVPYIVSFPGNRYYEFDLSSEFYRRTHAGAAPQTITFNAYGSDAVVAIAVDHAVNTAVTGYSHNGTYMEKTDGGVLGMDATGVMFDKDYTTVMPFRTYMHVESSPAKSRAATVWIGGDATGIENIIEGEEPGYAEETIDGDYVRVYAAGKQRIGVESTYATTLKIYTSSGQLYRLLDVRPGTMTYSGFQPGLYVAGKRKLVVK